MPPEMHSALSQSSLIIIERGINVKLKVGSLRGKKRRLRNALLSTGRPIKIKAVRVETGLACANKILSAPSNYRDIFIIARELFIDVIITPFIRDKIIYLISGSDDEQNLTSIR